MSIEGPNNKINLQQTPVEKANAAALNGQQSIKADETIIKRDRGASVSGTGVNEASAKLAMLYGLPGVNSRDFHTLKLEPGTSKILSNETTSDKSEETKVSLPDGLKLQMKAILSINSPEATQAFQTLVNKAEEPVNNPIERAWSGLQKLTKGPNRLNELATFINLKQAIKTADRNLSTEEIIRNFKTANE